MMFYSLKTGTVKVKLLQQVQQNTCVTHVQLHVCLHATHKHLRVIFIIAYMYTQVLGY